MLLDIFKAIIFRWELNETMPKRKSCTSRDGAWPIESDMFEYRFYLTIRLQARVFYEQIVNEAQPSWLSLVENEGE